MNGASFGRPEFRRTIVHPDGTTIHEVVTALIEDGMGTLVFRRYVTAVQRKSPDAGGILTCSATTALFSNPPLLRCPAVVLRRTRPNLPRPP